MAAMPGSRRSGPFTVFNVVAARPNFPKVAPIDRAMRARPGRFRPVLVHTGQHYDDAMSDAFLRDLGLPAPDHHLGVGSGSHAEQTAEAMRRFEALVLRERPDLVLVVGDVNSTLACAIAAAKCGVPVAHVEAGLRSFDRTMPEEINRVVTDVVADLLFVTERAGVRNLRREGIGEGSRSRSRKGVARGGWRPEVHRVGDVMVDALVWARPRAAAMGVPGRLGLAGDYALLTMHRPANVDDRGRFTRLLDGIERVAALVPVVFPVHPRTAKRIVEHGLENRFSSIRGLTRVEPLGYLEFLSLLDGCRFAITDSGGIPEECTFLGIPCLTLRETTERPDTVTHGINVLVGDSAVRLLREARRILRSSRARRRPPRGWDGRAAERTVEAIERFLRRRRR